MNARKFGRDLDTVLDLIEPGEERAMFRKMHRVLRRTERKALRRLDRERREAERQGTAV